MDGTRGMVTHTLDEDGTGPGSSRGVTVRGNEIFETNGDPIGTLSNIDGAPSFVLSKTTGMGTPDTTIHTAVNPKAIAIGAESVVRGDESIAIGHGAEVVRVETDNTLPIITHMLTDADGVIHHVTIRGDLVIEVVGETITRMSLSDINADPSFTLSKDFEVIPPVTTRENVNRAVAVGASSEVELNNGVAIGAGARVLQGIATHSYDPDGDGPMAPVQVEVFQGTLYEVNSDGVRGDLIGTLAGIDASSPDFTLERIGPLAIDASGGVAIGADVEVVGTGIAIGSDTTGVDAEGNITPAVATAADEIRIGNAETHTGAINIGDVDVRAEIVRIDTNEAGIAANVDNILNNGAAIKRNNDAITKNTSDISTNTKGIASAIAIAGLATGPGSGLSVGFGTFQSETSIAIGYDNTFGAEKNMTLKVAGASAGSGSTAGSVSVRWAF